MCALALSSDEAEVLHGMLGCGAEPVWCAGVELGGFTGREDQVVFTEHEP